MLKGLGVVNVNEELIIGERFGHRSILIWGRLLRWLGKKNGMIRELMFYIHMILALMIVAVLPISLIIKSSVGIYLLKQKRYFEEPSGSAYNKVV